MSEEKKKPEEENVHEKFIREMQQGTRRRKAFANNENGLHVDYEEEEFKQYLPSLYEELTGSKKGKKISISSVREEDNEDDEDSDFSGIVEEEEFDGKIISEEEHLKDYFNELKSKAKNPEDKPKEPQKENINAGSQKEIYRAKREALEKLLKTNEPDSKQQEPSSPSVDNASVPKKEPVDYSKYKRTKEEIIALTKSKPSYHTEENDELFNPNIISFLRRCRTEPEAQEIIDYMCRKGEITKEDAEKYTKQLKEQGVRSFGEYKAPGYYEKQFPRIQTEKKKKIEWNAENENFSSLNDDDDDDDEDD